MTNFFKSLKQNISDLFKLRRFYLSFYLINFGALIVIAFLILALSIPNFQRKSRKLITKNFISETKSEAYSIQNNLYKESSLIINLRNSFSKFNQIPNLQRRRFYKEILKETMYNNPEIVSIFTIWKPYTFDSLQNYKYLPDNKISQFAFWLYKTGSYLDSLNSNNLDYSLLYEYSQKFNRQASAKFLVFAPIKEYSVTYSDSVELVRFVTPIRNENNILLGIIGFDVPVDFFINRIETNELANLLLINKELKIIFATNRNLIDSKLTAVYPDVSKTYLLQSIILGKNYADYGRYFNKKVFIYEFPINISKENQWAIIKYYPANIFAKYYKKIIFLYVLILIFLIITTTAILIFALQRISIKQLRNFEYLIYKIYQGDIDIAVNNKLFVYKEFHNIRNLVYKLLLKYNSQVEFVEKLGKGEYNIEPLKIVSEKDLLSINLNRLADQLRRNRLEQEKLKELQQVDAWKSEGLAKINDILRTYINDLETLAYEIIKNLTDYLDAQVGAFFQIKDVEDRQVLVLLGYYGYNRRIYEKREIGLGDGLSGSVVLEKKYIITKVPDDYVELATGLGKAKPNYIAVFPLIANEVVYGTIEIAKIEEFKEYQVEFLTEISAVVASTLAAAKISAETQRLLKEQQLVAKKMQKEQEQLKQTIAELEKTSNELQSENKRLKAVIDAISLIAYYAEFAPNKSVITVNKLLLTVLGITYAEATAKTYFDLFQIPFEDIDKHNQYWQQLHKSNKIITFEMRAIMPDEKKLWLKAALVPIWQNKQLDRVLFIAINITELKEKEDKFDKLQLELSETKESLRLVQEAFDGSIVEIESYANELEEKGKKIEELEKQVKELKQMHQTLAKEFEKRIKRHRTSERELRARIRELEDEIRKYKREYGTDDKEDSQSQG